LNVVPFQASTFRTGVKEIAQLENLIATFCSKPFGTLSDPGNGGHFNFSLWEGARSDDCTKHFGTKGMRNIMKSEDGKLSQEGQNFIAGVLDHAPGLQALCSPTPPCYSRAGHWAPTHGIYTSSRCINIYCKSRFFHASYTADWGFEDRCAAGKFIFINTVEFVVT
jgi:glutamine synthetase